MTFNLVETGVMPNILWCVPVNVKENTRNVNHASYWPATLPQFHK